MAKRAIIVLADGFEEIEAVTINDIARRAEIHVTVAGLENINVTGSRGLKVVADKKLDDVELNFDACIFPGGMPGATNLANSKKVEKLIQKLHQEGKLIAAICASPAIVLAPTGILKNKLSTCYPGMQDNFGKNTTYKEENVVVDGNIITSRGPATALEFSFAIVENLVGKDEADKIRKVTLAK